MSNATIIQGIDLGKIEDNYLYLKLFSYRNNFL